jgi:hypothetical protein
MAMWRYPDYTLRPLNGWYEYIFRFHFWYTKGVILEKMDKDNKLSFWAKDVHSHTYPEGLEEMLYQIKSAMQQAKNNK